MDCDHGWSITVGGDAGAGGGAESACGIGDPRRSGPGAGGFADAKGWTSPEIAAAFGATSDSVRHWRNWFVTGGVEALRSTIAPGPSPEKGERALLVARDVLCAPVENRPNWTPPRLQAEIERRAGISISKSRLSILLREKGGSVGAGPGTR